VNETKRATSALVLVGVASIGVYVVALVLQFPLSQMYANRPYTIDSGIFSPSSIASFAAGLVVLFVLYGFACRIASRIGHNRGTILIVLGFGALFAVIATLVYPLTSNDIYTYFFFGRILEHHHANPLVTAPALLPPDPLIGYAPWPDFPYPYGPVWALLSAAVSHLAGDDLLIALLLFKSLQITAYLATTLVIYRVLRSHGDCAPAAGALFFAWNPLVLLEMVVNGHNDGLVALLLVSAIWATLESRGRWGILLLAASMLVKITPAALMPVFVVWVFRHSANRREGVRECLAGIVLAALLIGSLYAPFWAGSELLVGIEAQQDTVCPSLPAAIIYLSWSYGLDATVAVLTSSRFLFLAIESSLLLRLWRRKGDLCRLSFDVLLLLVLLTSAWFEPWYLLSLLAVAPTCDVARRKLVAVFSASAPTIYLFAYAAGIGEAQVAGTKYELALGYAAILTIYAPLALTALAESRRRALPALSGACPSGVELDGPSQSSAVTTS
jgi:alpha-1,6-mannosyltransferase